MILKLKRLFKINDIGEDVRYMQTRLKEKGFYKGLSDGYYGNPTLTSVKEFQQAHNLPITDVIDIRFWVELNKNIEVNDPVINKIITKDNLTIFMNHIDPVNYIQEKTTKTKLAIDITNYDNILDILVNKETEINGKKYNIINTYVILGTDNVIYNLYDDNCWSFFMEDALVSSETISILLCPAAMGDPSLLRKLISFIRTHHPINEIIYNKDISDKNILGLITSYGF